MGGDSLALTKLYEKRRQQTSIQHRFHRFGGRQGRSRARTIVQRHSTSIAVSHVQSIYSRRQYDVLLLRLSYKPLWAAWVCTTNRANSETALTGF